MTELAVEQFFVMENSIGVTAFEKIVTQKGYVGHNLINERLAVQQ